MKVIHILVALLVLTTIPACAPSPAQQATLIATALTATAAVWTPTLTASSTATDTPVPTQTVTPTQTATPAPSPTATVSSTQTSDASRYNSPDQTFSLIPPEGWHTYTIGGQDYPSLLGPRVNDYDLRLDFFHDESQFSVWGYSAFFQDSLKKEIPDLIEKSEDFPTTSTGINYFRWIIEFTQQGVGYRQAFYMFGNGTWILIIRYTRLSGQPSQYDDLVEKSIDTIQITNYQPDFTAP